MNILAKYNYYLAKRPLATKMITSGCIGAFGDVLCQSMEKCKQFYFKNMLDYSKEAKPYNFNRSKTFFLVGTFFIAPILHVNYSKILPYLVPEISAVGALKKLAFDQLVAAPLIILCFYPVINFIEGKPLS